MTDASPEKPPLLLPATRALVGPLAALRVAQVLLMPLILWLLPPERHFNLRGWVATVRGNTGMDPTHAPGLAESFQGYHYITIAAEGYPQAGPELAFYPLWPALMAPFGRFALPAGVTLAVLLSLGALVLLHDLVARRWDADLARWTVLLLALFPGAIFLSLPYSESLFLLLAVGVFWALETDRRGLAAVLAGLMPLARPVGVLMALPLLWDGGRRALAGDRSPTALLRALGPAFALPVGYASYFVWMALAVGDPFAGFDAQQGFAPSSNPGDLLDVFAFVGEVFDWGDSHDLLHSPLDRALFFWFLLALLPLVRRWRTDGDLLLYAAALGFVPALTVHFMAYSRYVMVVFPAFMATALLLKQSPWTRWLLLPLFGGLQVVLMARHLNHWWVA